MRRQLGWERHSELVFEMWTARLEQMPELRWRGAKPSRDDFCSFDAIDAVLTRPTWWSSWKVQEPTVEEIEAAIDRAFVELIDWRRTLVDKFIDDCGLTAGMGERERWDVVHAPGMLYGCSNPACANVYFTAIGDDRDPHTCAEVSGDGEGADEDAGEAARPEARYRRIDVGEAPYRLLRRLDLVGTSLPNLVRRGPFIRKSMLAKACGLSRATLRKAPVPSLLSWRDAVRPAP